MNKRHNKETNISKTLLEECRELSKKEFTPEFINTIENSEYFIKELSDGKKFDNFYKILGDELSKATFIKVVKYRYMLSFNNEILDSYINKILFSMFYPTSNYFIWLFKIAKFYILKKHKHPKGIKISPIFNTSLVNEYSIKDVFEIKSGDSVFDIASHSLSSIDLLSKKITALKIYALESNRQIFEVLKTFESTNILPHNIILSNFEEEANSLYAIKSEDNKININLEAPKVITLDHFIRKQKIDKVDVIRIHTCGKERLILEGAKNTIRRLRPKICVYLYNNDNLSFDIFDLIKTITPNYKYYLRTSTPFANETILYCVPDNIEVS